MKPLRLALIFSALVLCARAQRDPEPIPDFTNLDEFIYEPKTTLSIGVRTLSGAKTSFSGQGKIRASIQENPGNATDANILRIYHDGLVQPDTRQKLVDDGEGGTKSVPIEPDGKTNTWNFIDDRQATAVPGFIAMHSYSAEIVDTGTRSKDGQGTMGMELAVARDMGKIFHTRLTWTLSAGMTINDISALTTDKMKANLTTLTDLYSLNGQTAPAAPYQAPSTTLVPAVDASGNPLKNEDGSDQMVTVENTTLLQNSPASRTSSVTTDSTSVTNIWRLKGAYYTFRAGPTIWVPISNRFRASISVGGTLIYCGANYAVLQTYQPEIGAEVSEVVASDESKLLPGYYADATMQFDVTARTGFYAGAVFQGSGDYSQSINAPTANYTSKVQFGNQHGFRAGMTIKF